MYVTMQEIISDTLALDRISELYLLIGVLNNLQCLSRTVRKKACLFILLHKILCNNKGHLVHFNPKMVSSYHSLAFGL